MTSIPRNPKESPYQQPGTGVLVVGDVMLDVWTHAQVRKRSPEAPVDVVKVAQVEFGLGGAANAFLSTEDFLPGRNFLLGVIGDDYHGELLSRRLDQFGDKTTLFKHPHQTTTVKNRLFVNGNQVLRIDYEQLAVSAPQDEDIFFQVVADSIEKVGCVLLSDYGKGVFSRRLTSKIVELTSRKAIPTIADPAIGQIGMYAGITAIKPNALEWATYLADFNSEVDALQLLWDQGTELVLVTEGRKGMRLLSPHHQCSIRDDAATATDVTGAGDVIAAACASLMACKKDIADNLEVLLRIGSRAVSFSGTRPENDIYSEFRVSFLG